MSVLNRRDEVEAKTFGLALVELGRGNELVLSVEMKLTLLTEAWSGPS